jgi:hypothetical protein
MYSSEVFVCLYCLYAMATENLSGNRRLHTRLGVCTPGWLYVKVTGVCTPDWLYVKVTGVRHLAGAQTPTVSMHSSEVFVCLDCLYAMATENLPGTGVCTPAGCLHAWLALR